MMRTTTFMYLSNMSNMIGIVRRNHDSMGSNRLARIVGHTKKHAANNSHNNHRRARRHNMHTNETTIINSTQRLVRTLADPTYAFGVRTWHPTRNVFMYVLYVCRSIDCHRHHPQIILCRMLELDVVHIILYSC